MTSRLLAFVNWGLVVASLVFWGVLSFRPVAAPTPETAPGGASSAAAGLVAGDGTQLSRLLGAATPANGPDAAAAPPESSRFKLSGVMAPRTAATPPVTGSSSAARAGTGWALISVDGKPPRPYAVGERVDGEWRLQSVALRSASLGQPNQAAVLRLDLPAPAAPSTGSLAAAVALPLDEFASPSGSARSPTTAPALAGTPPGLSGQAASAPRGLLRAPRARPAPTSPPVTPQVAPGADLPTLPPESAPAASRPAARPAAPPVVIQRPDAFDSGRRRNSRYAGLSVSSSQG